MADLAQLEAALVKADAAGDVDSARQLAAAVRQARVQTQTPPAEQRMSGEDVMKKAAPYYLGPFGLARGVMDASHALDKAAYGAGDKVSETATKLGASPEISAGAGTVANLGIQSIPMLFGGGLGAKAAPLVETAAQKLMQSAIKPATGDLLRGKVEPAIQTMLEQGFSPTNAGVAGMREKAAGYTDRVKEILDRSNKVIDVNPVDQNLNALAERLKAGTLGTEKVKDVKDVSKALHEHPSVEAGTMSVQDAQAMKQANYRDIGDNAYGLNVKEQTARDSLKAATAALRKGIETAEPSVGELNALAGELLNAAKVSQRRALVEGNKDVLPLGAGIASAVHNPAAALGMYANSSAYLKSLLARMLYSGKETIPQAAGQVMGAGAGMQSGTPPSPQDLMAAQLKGQK